MKKFEIRKIDPDSWMVSHNELPRFKCHFENKKFNYSRTITGLSDPPRSRPSHDESGNPFVPVSGTKD